MRKITAIGLLLSIASICGRVQAEPGATALVGPTAATVQTLQTVAKMLPKYHLSQQPLDNDVSRRWLRAFLRDLDVDKSYFNQADVDRFLARQEELDEMAQRGDTSLAFEIVKVFLERVDERAAVIKELLAAPHDFSVDEEIVTDFDTATYATNADEAREHWRKKIKLALLMRKGDRVNDDEARKKVERQYEGFRQRIHQMNDDELLEYYLTALAAAYDPHSTYLSAKTLEDFEISTRQQLDGIGAQLQMVDAETLVVRVVPGGPSAKDGRLQAGDRIVGIGQGDAGEIASVVSPKLSDVVKQIRGKAGTVVRLQVMPKGRTESVIYNVTRGKVQVEEAQGALIERERKSDGAPFRAGYIRVPDFYSARFRKENAVETKTVTDDVRRILDDPQRGFRAASVDVVILDLRTNAGGTLAEAVNLPGLFTGPGPVLLFKGTDGKLQHYQTEEKTAVWDGPLVVLTSRLTAAGAEILAAALQDYGRALVIGDSATKGQGTVQSVLDIGQEIVPKGTAPKLGALKVTKEQFYRVSGDSTQMRGVTADIILPSRTDHQKLGEAFLPQALPFERVRPMKHTAFSMVTPEQKQQLQARSQARRAKSPDFQKLADEIVQLDGQKNRKSASLNEKSPNQVRPTTAADETSTTGPLFDARFDNDEILAIARDYVELFGK